METQKLFAVLSSSSYRTSTILVQGYGETEQKAWVDAIGSFDKKEVKKSLSKGWFCKEVTRKELGELWANS